MLALMKNPFARLFAFVAAFLAFGNKPTVSYMGSPLNPARAKFGKSSGGKSHHRKYGAATDRKKAWKRVFGGLAVPNYVA